MVTQPVGDDPGVPEALNRARLCPYQYQIDQPGEGQENSDDYEAPLQSRPATNPKNVDEWNGDGNARQDGSQVSRHGRDPRPFVDLEELWFQRGVCGHLPEAPAPPDRGERLA